MRGKGIWLLALGALWCMGTSAWAQTPTPQPFQPMVVGSTYTMDENYALTLTIHISSLGDINITASANLLATTTYTVLSDMQYTQACTATGIGPDATNHVYNVQYTGALNLIGTVNNVPLFNSIPIKTESGATYSGNFYLRDWDLATVAQLRTIKGNVDAFLVGSWQPAAKVKADAWLDWIPDLEQYQWPLYVGMPGWAQNNHACLYGDYNAQVTNQLLYQILPAADRAFGGVFDQGLDLNFSHSVFSMATLKANFGTSYSTYKCIGQNHHYGAQYIDYYSPAARWFLKEQIANLSAISSKSFKADIRQAYLEVKSFTIPGQTTTPTPTGGTMTPTPTGQPTWTPTPTPPMSETPTPTQAVTVTPTTGPGTPTATPQPTSTTPTATPTGTSPHTGIGIALHCPATVPVGGDFNLSLEGWNVNPTATDPLNVWVALELEGTLYFYPAFTVDPAPWFIGISLPAEFDMTSWYQFFNFSNSGAGGLQVTFYGAFLNSDNQLVGTMGQASTTLE